MTTSRVLDLAVQVVDRALVEPVRSGRLRAQGWPPGLRAVVSATLVLYVGLAVVTVAGHWLRQALPAGSSLFGIAPELLGPATAITAILAAIVTTAGMHAPLALRVTGLLAPLLLWSAQLWLATDLGQLIWAAVGAVAIVLLHALRAGKRFVWWEPVAALLVVGGVTFVNLVTVVRPALDAGHSDPSLVLVLTVMSVGALGLGYAVTSGAAVSEIAMSTSAWFVEHLSRRFSTRTQLIVILALGALAWGALVLRLSRSVVPGPLLGVGVLIGVTMLTVTLLSWLLLDRVMDQREIRSGRRPGHTDLADIAEAFQPLAVAVGIALALPHAANTIWANLERGLRLPLSALGLDYVPTDLASRSAPSVVGVSGLAAAGAVLAIVMCVVVAVRAVRAGRRGQAELALVVGLFCTVSALNTVGVPFLAADLDTLAVATLVIVTTVGGTWVLRRQVTIARLHAIAVALLLAGAISARDLLADPLGWLLGSAGGALLVLGLVWNLLTNADPANGDSPRFPRPSRTLVVVGYLTAAMLVAASDALAVSFAVDLDRFLQLGAEVIGTALLATATWAVLATGARDAPTVEPGRPTSTFTPGSTHVPAQHPTG